MIATKATIEATHRSDLSTIRCAGVLSSTEREQLLDAFLGAIDRSPDRIEFNCDEVVSISSDCVGVLADSASHCWALGITFQLKIEPAILRDATPPDQGTIKLADPAIALASG
ncbi:MAG: STAS domain-containing protein [Actinomycetota bacterium]|nr:hypothetical protein [Actinomycetota bacterium]